jgi:AGCS family alanine or glycine:cation symporter
MALIEKIVWEYLWGMPLIILSLFVGIYFTFFSGFFQFRFAKHAFKVAFGKFFAKSDDKEEGTISPMQALSVAIGATVGVGNIGGVATAIAVGGPGAVFWLWVAGILGQVIKMAEISLAVHYRSKSPDGSTYGGPTYYIKKGLGIEKKLKPLANVLAFIFIFGFGVGFVITMQNYTVAEAVSSTFNVNMITVSVVYTILLYLMIAGGLKSLGKIASYLVPFMCLFYILGGLFIIGKNVGMLPGVFGMIFNSAFTGTAAVGGFAGAAFTQVIKIGMSRAVFSNEAGWGSSPMIHASAKTNHPVSQGILGIFEVFIDTIVICTITSLVILVTGEWSSGISGAALTLSAFESGVGELGRFILTIGILLFGVTTSSGIYAQIEVLVRYVLGEGKKAEKIILTVYKWSYPLPGLLLVIFAVANGLPGTSVWLFADMSTALPIFANLTVLVLLSGKFFALLKDYKARYMGIGEVDPNFKVFYEDDDKATENIS